MPEWMIKDKILEQYLTACKEANINDFKRDLRLTRIFEHCSEAVGYKYLRNVIKDNAQLLDIEFTNDLYGNPVIHDYETIKASASTLQYIGVLSNIIKEFGSLNGKRIVEIGGGYGGQCRTILDIYKPDCYHIIDLPEVCELQMRYLEGLPVECFTEPTRQKYDLVISNYAISEIPDNSEYMEQIIAKSKHGYLTCNTEFVQLNFEHNKRSDIKGESINNYILTW